MGRPWVGAVAPALPRAALPRAAPPRTGPLPSSHMTEPLLPPPDGALTPLHTRDYRVEAYQLSDREFLLRGAVMDTKPADLYVDGDTEPLVMHHMLVEMRIGYPALDIRAVDVRFETHPQESCPRITDHYANLVGLSIARGFTHKVRELFGGPRGCTHTTALLQAMAPVAVQCTWSMRVAAMKSKGMDSMKAPAQSTPEQRRAALALNINTCHVWEEDGEVMSAVMRGEPATPIPIVNRLRERGENPQEWLERNGPRG